MTTALWRPGDRQRYEPPVTFTAAEIDALARLRDWHWKEWTDTLRQWRDLQIARWEYRHGHERWSEWTIPN